MNLLFDNHLLLNYIEDEIMVDQHLMKDFQLNNHSKQKHEFYFIEKQTFAFYIWIKN